MEYRRLGHSGLKVSVAGLGCNNFGMRLDQAESTAVIHAALDAGVNFFDTAYIYGGGQSEEFIGNAIAGRRDEVVLATKFGLSRAAPDGSRGFIIRSLETSLRRLKVDHVDLYHYHFPDLGTPLDETLGALSTLIEQGKVRYAGASNFPGFLIADAWWTSDTKGLQPFVSVQNQWSLLDRSIEQEVTQAAARFSVSILPYFPLASGMLTGKVRRGGSAPVGSRLSDERFGAVLTEENFTKVERLEEWAKAHDMSMPEVSLSWLASQPVVGSVIAGATSPEQVRANADATRTDLSPAEIAAIGAVVSG
jgi:aryl-alcohol dehydrogenase-like predicted oxidoreductase